MPWRRRWNFVSWRINLLAFNLAGPGQAVPPGDLTRPARCISGFWIRQVHARHFWEPTQEQTLPTTNNSLTVHQHFGTRTESGLRSCLLTTIPKLLCLFEPFPCKACLGNTLCFRVDLLKAKPGHTNGRWGRSARPSGREKSGKIVCQQNYLPSKQMCCVLSKASKNIASATLQKHAQAKSYVNRPRNTVTGLSAVYPRFIGGARSALCSWLPTSRTTTFCLYKPFFMQGMSGKNEFAFHRRSEHVSNDKDLR